MFGARVGAGASGSVFKGTWIRSSGEEKVVAIKQVIGMEPREVSRLLQLCLAL